MLNRKKTFLAGMNMFHPALQWFKESIQDAGLTQQAAFQLELAFEEAWVNVVQYAYPEQIPGDIEMSIGVLPNQEIVIVLKDRGVAFDPLKSPAHNPIEVGTPLEEIQEGSLGIFFMKQYVDELFYERREPYNVLTMKKLMA